MSKVRSVCFTDFELKRDYWQTIDCKYIIYGEEKCPDTGKEHLQGYIVFNNPRNWSALQKEWNPMHFEHPKGNHDQNYKYCTKTRPEDKVPNAIVYERGIRPKQGKRTDLESAIESIKEGGIQQCRLEHPTTYVKFIKNLNQYARETKKRPRDQQFTPRAWQQKIIDVVKAPVNDRHIYWIHDSKGGQGKSRLCKHLQCEYGAVLLQGKVADMAYMFDEDNHKIAVFNLTRTQADNCKHLYSFAESLKDGLVVSTKYESCQKVFDPVHVFFFANFYPPSGIWSEDRLQLIELDPVMSGTFFDYQPQ